MKSTDMEPLLAAPLLLNAFRKGQEEFGMAATSFSAKPRVPVTDAASEESLELLDHLVDRLREDGTISREGLEDACIFLLEHLAARLHERQELQKCPASRGLIQ
jgi:hypothetical protein